jgi:hypothetical protein
MSAEPIEQFAARVLGMSDQEVMDELSDAHHDLGRMSGKQLFASATAEWKSRYEEAKLLRSEMLKRQHARAVPASRPALDVTGEDVFRAIERGYDSPVSEWPKLTDAVRKAYTDAAAFLNERTGRHATDTGWVQCPTTQTAGELVVPETGVYMAKVQGDSLHYGPYNMTEGNPVAPGFTAIRRIDTDAPTTWITRTPTTSRVWTAESCEQFVGKLCVEQCEGGYSETQRWDVSETPARIAECLNGWNVVSVYILPQDGPR